MSTPIHHAPALVLGSTSRYRRELLQRLRVPFTCRAPDVDETPLTDESPADVSTRLALAKARAVAALCRQESSQDVVVIGSDQVADLGGVALGKPGNHERAVAQLQAMRGQSVVFHTSVAVTRPATGFEASATALVRVRFRDDFSDDEIQQYLHLDQPYDCAGSAKVESLGIVLLDQVDSDDPTALVGLPLIATTRLLRAAQFPLFASIAS
ncbi:MAG: septum formation protein Maf [Burkholderiales bacterium]|nr:septum formation protein Maf [Burkholderiales bacterium]